ncbi:RING-H2 finger protein atl46 [Phtheirospermum japonicum]|uniref:RING-H2 finger protein atl46 n=1 Tax=Phtheirospermum japonicum TaxID=374723 RepID=A0A830CR35_9LAMI|nr:RING-H2 finger protein atl46 [Phtheirospermum japonicum]
MEIGKSARFAWTMCADKRIKLRSLTTADTSFTIAASKSGCGVKTFALSVEELQYFRRNKMVADCFYLSICPS